MQPKGTRHNSTLLSWLTCTHYKSAIQCYNCVWSSLQMIWQRLLISKICGIWPLKHFLTSGRSALKALGGKVPACVCNSQVLLSSPKMAFRFSFSSSQNWVDKWQATHFTEPEAFLIGGKDTIQAWNLTVYINASLHVKHEDLYQFYPIQK